MAFSWLGGSVEVAAARDVAVAQRLVSRLQGIRSQPVELVVEDGCDRAVGQRADLDGAHRRRIEASGRHRPRQPQDTNAGPETLFGVRAALQDQRAKDADRRPDRVRVAADALDGPVRIATVTGWHVLRHRRVLAVAAAAPVSGDALATQEHLDRAGREPGIDLGPGITVRDAIEVVLDLDVIVDPDPADAPLR